MPKNRTPRWGPGLAKTRYGRVGRDAKLRKAERVGARRKRHACLSQA